MKFMNTCKKYGSKVAAGAAMVVAAPMAMAGDLATAWTTEASSAKAEILLIGVAILAVTGVIFLIRRSNSVAK